MLSITRVEWRSQLYEKAGSEMVRAEQMKGEVVIGLYWCRGSAPWSWWNVNSGEGSRATAMSLSLPARMVGPALDVSIMREPNSSGFSLGSAGSSAPVKRTVTQPAL